jgi:glutamate synthase (NADPH/NADH) small chain
MADNKMLRFVSLGRTTPDKRPAKARAADFGEIYKEFTDKAAADQAGRCSQCGVPFCQVACPLQNNIPDWLKMSAEGRLEEAYELSQATNNMPEICGRICPQDRLCEGSCVIEQSGHGTVTIGSIEKYISDTAWEKGWVKPIRVSRETGLSVGIIGAGPAGLAAAEQLRAKGHTVTIYDRYDRAGGLLTYGIPNFKLEKETVLRRVTRLEESGIAIKYNADVGKSLPFAKLRKAHNAVLIATGVYKARDMQAPGIGLPGIVQALPYLTASNRVCLGEKVRDYDNGTLNAKDRNVVVIGGGDTAMDCVRTAIRQGAKSVTCLYRRDRENMPGSLREVSHAEEEGVVFSWLAAPKAFQGDKRVSAVRAVRMRLGIPDATGRQAPEEIPGSDFNLQADLVIMALGFDPEDLGTAFGESELVLTKWGTLKVDNKTMMTSMPGVFAAGDIVRGASLVVWAIKDGRDAADGIQQFLEMSSVRPKRAAAE